MPFSLAYLNLDSGKPVRFLALVWYEGWEFDHPTLLLEPIVRYSPNGTDPEGMIEDVAIDLCVDLERQDAILDEDVSREFEWRGWSLERLRKVAAACLAGRRLLQGLVRHLLLFNQCRRDGFNRAAGPTLAGRGTNSAALGRGESR